YGDAGQFLESPTRLAAGVPVFQKKINDRVAVQPIDGQAQQHREVGYRPNGLALNDVGER
ncbi:MAG: hypothetical protein ACK53Y_19655, partial [bacterium]